MSRFSIISLIRIYYPSSTSYEKTAESILTSSATQTENVPNGRDVVIP